MSDVPGDDRIRVVHVPSFAPPKGYVNGIVARGRRLYIAGQVGWNEREEIVGDDMATQFVQALDNVLAVVRAAGGAAGDIVRMTVFVTDIDAYTVARGALRQAWRERFGRHYPAMSLIGVARLLEPGAKVEIEAVAELADETQGVGG